MRIAGRGDARAAEASLCFRFPTPEEKTVDLPQAVQDELLELEEAMWKEETRYDPTFQQTRFADDFLEFGRSGRVYTRDQALLPAAARRPTGIRLPLEELRFRALGPDVVQITYNSHVDTDGRRESARRSSIWSRVQGRWVMRFHQGTPYTPADEGTPP